VCALLRTQLESQLTTKLDKDELRREGDPIGDGAYGVVYRGEYRGLPVAIKLLKHQSDLTSEMLADFQSEISIMEKLRHPAILGFVGAVHVRGNLAIVTEWCPYGSLFSALQKRKFSDELKCKVLLDAASGMNFLHQSGIIHRDLFVYPSISLCCQLPTHTIHHSKPDNLLLVSLEPKGAIVCKLSDFGTTRDVNRFATDMQSTRGIGTPVSESVESRLPSFLHDLTRTTFLPAVYGA
jgi:serine/threonine protein kinase